MITLGPNATKILALVLQGQQLGYPPTYRQLATALGFKSTQGPCWHLDRLKRAGLITWEPQKQGTLRPTCRVIPAGDLP